MMPGTSAGSPWLVGEDFCAFAFGCSAGWGVATSPAFAAAPRSGPCFFSPRAAASTSATLIDGDLIGASDFLSFRAGGTSFLVSFAAGLAGAVPPPRAAARMSATLILPASAFLSFGAGGASFLASFAAGLAGAAPPPRAAARMSAVLMLPASAFFSFGAGGASFLASFAAGLAGAVPPPRAAARMSAVLMLPASAFFSFGAGGASFLASFAAGLAGAAPPPRAAARMSAVLMLPASAFFSFGAGGASFLASFAAGLAGAAPPPRAAARMSAVLIPWSASEVAGFFFEATSAFGVDFLLGETEGAASVPPSRFSSTTEVSAVVLARRVPCVRQSAWHRPAELPPRKRQAIPVPEASSRLPFAGRVGVLPWVTAGRRLANSQCRCRTTRCCCGHRTGPAPGRSC